MKIISALLSFYFIYRDMGERDSFKYFFLFAAAFLTHICLLIIDSIRS